MNDCQSCAVETHCHYPHKPCECVHQRKFWSAERREVYDVEQKRLAQQHSGEQK